MEKMFLFMTGLKIGTDYRMVVTTEAKLILQEGGFEKIRLKMCLVVRESAKESLMFWLRSETMKIDRGDEM
jgi:hypothetical protein